MLRNYRRVYSYVTLEFIFAFLVAFLFFFFIFFINQLLVMAEEIFSKKVPMWDVILLVVYSLPAIIALSFPFGALVGALMTVGKFAANNEVLAFQASGVSPNRVFLPLLILGLFFSVLSFVVNDYFLPLGNLRLGSLYRRILYTNPGIELKPYSIKKYEDTLIVTGAIDGKIIKNIVIVDKTPEQNTRIITAENAYLEDSTAQKGVISMHLNNVFTQVSVVKRDNRFEYSTSQKLIYNLLLKNISLSLISPGPGEMSSYDVWQKIKEKEVGYLKKQELHRENIVKNTYETILELQAMYFSR